jgi:hypothetical protein
VDSEDAERQIELLGRQLMNVTLTLLEAQRTIRGLRKIIDGYGEMFPELRPLADRTMEGVPGTIVPEDVDPPQRPRGAEAVALILQEHPGEWAKISDLVRELREREWLPTSENPANAIRAAAERLVGTDESDIIKNTQGGTVFYSYQPDRAREYDEEPF